MKMGLLSSGGDTDFAAARRYLRQAIELHEKHIDGTAPTTGASGEKSQQRMMDLMVMAYRNLGPSKNALAGLLDGM